MPQLGVHEAVMPPASLAGGLQEHHVVNDGQQGLVVKFKVRSPQYPILFENFLLVS